MKPDGIATMDQTKVAIVGLGTVGTGVARLLLEHGDRIARHAVSAEGAAVIVAEMEE